MNAPERERHGSWQLTVYAVGFASSMLITLGMGCVDVDDVCEPGFCENEGETPYLCRPTTGFLQAECFTSDVEAVFWCQGKGGNVRRPNCDHNYGGTGEVGETGGTETTDGSNAPDWSPSEHVAFNPRLNHHEVDATFIEELRTDTSVLILDHAYVKSTDSGYYQLHNVRQGDLAYAMGLRSGDVFVDLNGYELNNLDSMLEAYDDLEYMDEFFLTVERGVDPVQFTYVIVDDR